MFHSFAINILTPNITVMRLAAIVCVRETQSSRLAWTPQLLTEVFVACRPPRLRSHILSLTVTP